MKDRDTKEKFAEDSGLGQLLTEGFLNHQILTRQRGNLIFLSPPLCITKDEVDFIVSNLSEIIGDVSEKLG